MGRKISFAFMGLPDDSDIDNLPNHETEQVNFITTMTPCMAKHTMQLYMEFQNSLNKHDFEMAAYTARQYMSLLRGLHVDDDNFSEHGVCFTKKMNLKTIRGRLFAKNQN